jgi:ABC-type dipeptide/oligopeptide/nickel transport system permease component
MGYLVVVISSYCCCAIYRSLIWMPEASRTPSTTIRLSHAPTEVLSATLASAKGELLTIAVPGGSLFIINMQSVSRIVRAFLIEEQKIVKKVLAEKGKKKTA